MFRYLTGLRFALSVLVCAGALFAQRDLATLAGTVTDPSGGVVPNAKVTITEVDTGEVYSTITNTVGEFVRPALKASTYTVAVTAPGFKRSEQANVILTAGERTGIKIVLTIGENQQTVEVEAAAPLLQTESTQVGAALDTKTVTDVPLGGTRNLTYLARLSPGVVPAEPGARDAANGGFSANGVRSNGQNNFLLNGVDNNINTIDFLNQTAYAIGPAIDAVSEVNIQTNGYNAEYGRAAGGVINVVLKSGTNALHGSLFEYLANKDLDANTWTNDRAGQPIGPFVQNQFGATAGGPIKKNVLFIFGDYQGTRIADSGGSVPNLGYSGYTTVPTAAMKTGNFASLLGPSYTGTDVNGNPISIAKGMIYDPASTTYQTNSSGFQIPVSRTPFPGNIIPQSRFDPAWAQIIQLYPNPNEPVITGNAPTNDYYYDTTGALTTDQGDARVDYHLSEKDSLFGSLSWSNTSKTDGAPLPGALDDTGFNGAGEIDLSRNGQVSYTRVWSPRIVTESRVGFTRLVTSRIGANPGVDDFTKYGIGGYDPTGAAANNGGLPEIGFSNGYPTVGATDWVPTKEYNNVWDLVQNVAISKGSHAYKVGFEFRSVKFPFFQVPDPHGNLGFSSNETAFPSANNASNGSSVSSLTGDAMASALLGVVDSGAISTTNFVSSQKVAYAAYAQDDWKLNSKLTLNLGVRYELWSPIGEQWGRQANFDLQNNTLYIPQGGNCNEALPPNFGTLFPTVTVNRCNVSNYMVPWDKFDFGPRLGIAYNFMNKMVLRIGYGIFYGGEENQGGSPNRGEGVPFNETVNLTRFQGNSPYVGISQSQCYTCDYMPGGLSGGYPLSPFTLNAGVSMRGVQPDFDNPLVHKWNVVLQRELPGNMALELGYEGNHQAHQVVLWNSDTNPNLGTFNTAISGASLQEIQPACPTCQSVGNGLSMTSSFGDGNYAAGSAKLEKRFSRGLYFLASYVWSHALADSGTPLSGSSNLAPISNTNYNTAYSSASWDIRHSFTTAFNYELPFGRGKQFGSGMNRVADLVVGGWQMNGILTLRTGVPITMNGANCHGVWNRCMPDYASGYTGNGNTPPPGGRSANEWFNTADYVEAFSNQAAGIATGGDVGLQSMTGAPTETLDFSMFKDFRVTERFHFQFRAEALNLTNFAVLSQPDVSIGDSKVYGGNGNFGVITSSVAGTERHVQFSLRLMF
ncbi:MAG TPA: carboxypeptidase regulatory-like domain-containing protein [Bryobacteraceae bacterium]|nr:carboxypeptidase regulatory-like domain-containing protein [Bryobacteraceae bacterium]